MRVFTTVTILSHHISIQIFNLKGDLASSGVPIYSTLEKSSNLKVDVHP